MEWTSSAQLPLQHLNFIRSAHDSHQWPRFSLWKADTKVIPLPPLSDVCAWAPALISTRNCEKDRALLPWSDQLTPNWSEIRL